MAQTGNTITLKHNQSPGQQAFFLRDEVDVVLSGYATVAFVYRSNKWYEVWRDIAHAHETDFELRIPLANPIVASAATQLEDWIHKKPYNVGHRINKLYARAASNVGGDCTFKLQKNGSDITSATITIPSGARIPTSSTPVAFTEADLADADVITVVQTTARTDAINISIYVYGDRDVVLAVV
jgi:hypothetical protein